MSLKVDVANGFVDTIHALDWFNPTAPFLQFHKGTPEAPPSFGFTNPVDKLASIPGKVGDELGTVSGKILGGVLKGTWPYLAGAALLLLAYGYLDGGRRGT